MEAEHVDAETAERMSLARAYLTTLLPMLDGPMRSMIGSLADRLDWERLLEPLAAPTAQALTADDMRHAIAWNESATCAKLLALQPKVQELIKTSVALELARLMASGAVRP